MNIDQPLNFYTGEKYYPMVFHLFDVGEGLMLLVIFPDQTTVLFDCNLNNDNCDEITKYLESVLPERINPSTSEQEKYIDVFINSHRDIDHLRGLNKIVEKFEIKSIWDSGQTGGATQDDDYLFYMNLRRSIIEKSGENAVVVPYPSPFPLKDYGGAKVYCLCSSLDFVEDSTRGLFQKFSEAVKAKEQHSNSLVISIEYCGKRLLLTGDSDWIAWKEKITPNFNNLNILSSEILFASHHGSRSFFTDEINDHIDINSNPETTFLEALDYIKPTITLISCAQYDSAHHPNKEALEIYKENTKNEQVYTTYEKGAMVGYIDFNGNWTVCPTRFSISSNCFKTFSIECYEIDSNSMRNRKISGETFQIGNSVEFSIIAKGGVLDPNEKVDVFWEVSNGGIEDNYDHQEIYYKRKDELYGKYYFHRDISYKGIHLLRCRLINKEKNYDITRIFKVIGTN